MCVSVGIAFVLSVLIGYKYIVASCWKWLPFLTIAVLSSAFSSSLTRKGLFLHIYLLLLLGVSGLVVLFTDVIYDSQSLRAINSLLSLICFFSYL